MHPTFEIFNRTIGSYAVFALVGFAACAAVIALSCKKLKITFEDVIILMLIVACGLVVGGHLLYGIVNAPQAISAFESTKNTSVKQMLKILISQFGGLVFYGGFLGGLAALWIYNKNTNAVYKDKIFDIYAFSIPLFHTFGRIGCFFAGCCYGIKSEFGFVVNHNSLVPDVCGVKRFPVALLESLCNLILFIIIFTLFRKNKFSGKLILVYLITYPVIRFWVEFLRGDTARGIFFGLSTSQWISIVLLMCAAIKLVLIKIKRLENNKI